MDPVEGLRSHLSAVGENREALVAQVAAEVIARVPSYATTPSSEVWIGMNRILDRALEGDPFAEPTAEDLEAAAGTGIQGGRAWITAADLVAAVLLGARAVEDAVMKRAESAGVPASIQLDGARRARRWAEAVAVASVRGLEEAGVPDYLDPVIALIAGVRGGASGDELAALVTAAHLDAGANHYLVVARSTGTEVLDEVDAARLRFATPGAWATSGDSLVGVVRRRPGPVGSLVIGCSGHMPASRLAEAHVDADRACRVAHARLGAGCHDLDTLGLLVAVHEDAKLLERLDRRWLQPLRGEARHDLVRTVRIWQSTGQVDEAARGLGVHPNTVRNRLSRIDNLVPGWRLPQSQAELWAALVSAGENRDIKL